MFRNSLGASTQWGATMDTDMNTSNISFDSDEDNEQVTTNTNISTITSNNQKTPPQQSSPILLTSNNNSSSSHHKKEIIHPLLRSTLDDLDELKEEESPSSPPVITSFKSSSSTSNTINTTNTTSPSSSPINVIKSSPPPPPQQQQYSTVIIKSKTPPKQKQLEVLSESEDDDLNESILNITKPPLNRNIQQQQQIDIKKNNTISNTTNNSINISNNNNNNNSTIISNKLKKPLFKDIKFVVTSINENEERERIVKLIKYHGGQVITNLEEITNEEIILLIADDSTTKPNFLIALMMEIPLLKKEWIDECILKKELIFNCNKYLLNRGIYINRMNSKKIVKQTNFNELIECLQIQDRIFSNCKVKIIGSKEFKERWTPIIVSGGGKVLTLLKSQTSNYSNFIICEDYNKLDEKIKKDSNQLKLPILDRDSILEIIITNNRELSKSQVLNFNTTFKNNIKKNLNSQSDDQDTSQSDEKKKNNNTTINSNKKRKMIKKESSESEDESESDENEELIKKKKKIESSTNITNSIKNNTNNNNNINNSNKVIVDKQDNNTKQESNSNNNSNNNNKIIKKESENILENGFYFKKQENNSNIKEIIQIQQGNFEMIKIGDLIKTFDNKYFRIDLISGLNIIGSEYLLNENKFEEGKNNNIELPINNIEFKYYLNNNNSNDRIYYIENYKNNLNSIDLININQKNINYIKYNVNNLFNNPIQNINLVQFNNVIVQKNDFIKILLNENENTNIYIGQLINLVNDNLFIEIYKKVDQYYITTHQVISIFVSDINHLECLIVVNELENYNKLKNQFRNNLILIQN